MYTGMMIEELMEMVARAENHARDAHFDEAQDEPVFASRLLYDMVESQPMMIGVS